MKKNLFEDYINQMDLPPLDKSVIYIQGVDQLRRKLIRSEGYLRSAMQDALRQVAKNMFDELDSKIRGDDAPASNPD